MENKENKNNDLLKTPTQKRKFSGNEQQKGKEQEQKHQESVEKVEKKLKELKIAMQHQTKQISKILHGKKSKNSLG